MSIKILSAILGATCVTATPILIAQDVISMNNIESKTILNVNFDNKEIKNTVNNKTYNSTKGTHKFINSDKGKGFQANGSCIKIPKEDLNISEDDENMTVSLLYKFGGEDKDQILASFNKYDLFLTSGKLAFNTGNGDYYGINYMPPINKYIQITAIFNKKDVMNNKLYINGVKQNLEKLNPYNCRISANPFKTDFYIGNWGGEDSGYEINDESVIDEFKLIKGAITDDEALKLATAHRIPELTLRQEKNYIQPNWATEILDDDLIKTYTFEEGSELPSFTWKPNKVGDNTGGQKTTDTEAYNGKRSVYNPITINQMGNHYGFPDTSSNSNIMMFNRQFFPNGTKLSMSVRTKDEITSPKENTLIASGDGSWADSVYLSKTKYMKDAPKGCNRITVDKIGELNVGVFITSDSNQQYKEEAPHQIREVIDNKDGTYDLVFSEGFKFDRKKGEYVIIRPWRGAWHFGSKQHKSTEWKLSNLNAVVTDLPDYDVSKRGGSFYIDTVNYSNSYIDEVKFGYATKVKLYRDNNLIYEGYEAKYDDKEAIDKEKPVMKDINFNSKYENSKRKINFSFKKADDIGTDYKYSILSISKNGVSTFLSKDKSINITSGLKGYSYIIDKIPNSIPNNNVNLSPEETNITYDISDSDNDVYYLHIKPIDNNGNVGETKHIKVESPILKSKQNNKNNFIRLDWTVSKIDDKNFRLYQMKNKELKIIETKNNYLDDYTGQDTANPDKPKIYEHKFSNDGYLTFKFNPVNDNGSKYKYYVESKDKDNNIAVSNVSEATITTGVKGYSYVIDDKPNTVPDDVIEQSDNKDIKYKLQTTKNIYLHVKSIDNAGNSSEILHYNVKDSIKPSLKLELDKTNWTNKEVTIKATAIDKESGIKQIILPNGNVINSDIATFTVTKNGMYYFKAIDLMGNQIIDFINVLNIDKERPDVTIINNQNWINKDVDVIIDTKDK